MNKKVLIFFYAYPAFKAGGPVHSIESIVSSLNQKLDFTIISPNFDIDGSKINFNKYERSEKNIKFTIYLLQILFGILNSLQIIGLILSI